VLSAMGEQFTSLVDVTIVYPEGRPTFSDFLSGAVSKVKVVVQEKEIPADILQGDYENDLAFRQRFHQWVSELWSDKDQLMVREMAASA